jgi:hypothetical protein
MTIPGNWQEIWERASRSPYLVLLFVASILLSIASFWTTFVGIWPFVKIGLFAFFITAAIQSLLFVVSWRLGFMVAGKENVAGVDVLVFLVCLTLSVFFSFSSLFNVVFAGDQQQQASLGRVRDGVTAAVNEVDENMRRQLQERVDALRDSDGYGAWRESLLAVAGLAQRNEPLLRDSVAAQREQQQEDYRRLDEKARELAARKGTLDDDIARAEAELARLQGQTAPHQDGLSALEAEVIRLESEVVAAKTAMDAEEGGIGESGKPAGRGPEWNRLKQIHDPLAARLLLKKNELENRQGRLGGVAADMRKLNDRLRRDQLQKQTIDTEIEAARRDAEDARQRLLGSGSQGGVDATVARLVELPKAFESTADLNDLKQAELICNQLYDSMQALIPPPDGLAALSCDRGPITADVQRIDELQQELRTFQRQCTNDEAPSFHGMDFDNALSSARACLDVSKLPFRQIRAQRDELDRLEREEGEQASEFVKTTNALFAGEKLAWFALVIALSMDLLVLFTGLIGAKSATGVFKVSSLERNRDDPPEVAAIKSLLRHRQGYADKINGVRYEGLVDLKTIDSERERELVRWVLVDNVDSGMVLPSPDHQSRFYLRHDARKQFDEILSRQRAYGGHHGGPAPGQGYAPFGAAGSAGGYAAPGGGTIHGLGSSAGPGFGAGPSAYSAGPSSADIGSGQGGRGSGPGQGARGTSAPPPDGASTSSAAYEQPSAGPSDAGAGWEAPSGSPPPDDRRNAEPAEEPISEPVADGDDLAYQLLMGIPPGGSDRGGGRS